uniref:EGF-like domain-containing protein n=1 Tax=Setaria digitata TaxID=48799 RepID=A0A915PLL5_9BILA
MNHNKRHACTRTGNMTHVCWVNSGLACVGIGQREYAILLIRTLVITVMIANQTKFILKNEDSYEFTTLQTTTVAFSDANFSLTSKPNLKSTPKVSHSLNTTKNNGVHFGNIVKDSFEYLKELLGFTPDCLNGGTKTLRGECICPKFYRGHLCEELVCVNNGTLVKIPKLIPTQYACRCPYPEYIHGQHCEHVKCLNGGRPMDNGHCKCLDYWYTGQFCQEYAASWSAVLGLPLLCMVIIIICCVVCRLDLFPRKPVHPRKLLFCSFTTFSSYLLSDVQELLTNVSNAGMKLFIQDVEDCNMECAMENLLNDNPGESTVVLRPYGNFFPPCVIHLDSVPVLFPDLPANGNLSKPVDPPPSYEEAVSTFSVQQPVSRTDNGTTVLPPEYLSYSSPVLPRFGASNVSRNS